MPWCLRAVTTGVIECAGERVDAKGLEALIRRGDVDTVLTVFADGLGRLMGKRVVGRYFLDHVLADGVHACIYLFTVDMEMEPLPGFRLASWERGYGDMKLVPDLATWRLLPWLPKTALVFCDVYTEEGEPIEEAPRWVLRRQIERAKRHGLPRPDGVGARALPASRSPSTRRGPSATTASRRCRATSRTTTSCRPRGRRGWSAPSATTWRRRGCRSSSPRASGAEGRRRSTSATPRPSRWPIATCSTSTASRRSPGRRARPSRSWRSTTWAPPARRFTCTRRSGTRAAGRTSSPRRLARRGRRSSGTGWPGRWRWRASFAYFYAPTINSYKRYQAG